MTELKDRRGVVSVFLGTFPSREVFEIYLEETYDEDKPGIGTTWPKAWSVKNDRVRLDCSGGALSSSGVSLMPFLLLYLGDEQRFDERLITNALANLKGARPLKPGRNHLVFYHFERADDSTTIAFKKDRETITIDGSGHAACLLPCTFNSTTRRTFA
jgi:hypothetical protein